MNSHRVCLFLALFLTAGWKTLCACDSTAIINHANGNKHIVAKYNNNMPCGRWAYYNLEQKVYKREKYKNGKLVFTWLYNDKGRITQTINKKGKKREYAPCNCK